MMCKIIFTVPFYYACGAQLICLLVVTPWGYKPSVVAPAQPTSSYRMSHCSSSFVPTAEKKEENT
jgi:hypothetical protein